MRAMTRKQESTVREIFREAHGRLDVVEEAFARAEEEHKRRPTKQELKKTIRDMVDAEEGNEAA